ncbi:MAG: hypothetical protein WKF60_13405 [Ilumatobacter sp.]
MSAEQLLGSVPDEGLVIVADMEAGIGSLNRLDASAIDVTLVVVEPTPRSMDVALRGLAVAEAGEQGTIIIVANKVADDADRQRIVDAFGDRPTVFVPEDPAIDGADRRGVSPVDESPGSPAVVQIEQIVGLLPLMQPAGP